MGEVVRRLTCLQSRAHTDAAAVAAAAAPASHAGFAGESTDLSVVACWLERIAWPREGVCPRWVTCPPVGGAAVSRNDRIWTESAPSQCVFFFSSFFWPLSQVHCHYMQFNRISRFPLLSYFFCPSNSCYCIIFPFYFSVRPRYIGFSDETHGEEPPTGGLRARASQLQHYTTDDAGTPCTRSSRCQIIIFHRSLSRPRTRVAAPPHSPRR